MDYALAARFAGELMIKKVYNENPARRDMLKASSSVLFQYNRSLINRYKGYCKCRICFESEPVALDLHHLDPSSKFESPSKMTGYSTRRLKEEIRKCVVLCSNCHRKVHAGILSL